jgi:hypothetical protein
MIPSFGKAKEHNNAINADAKKLRRSFLAMQLFTSGYGRRELSALTRGLSNLEQIP